MPEAQSTYISQPSTTMLPFDPTPLLESDNSATTIILALAFLLWVLRPVMLQQSSDSSKKK